VGQAQEEDFLGYLSARYSRLGVYGLLNKGGRSILFEAKKGVGLSLQVLVDCTAFVIGGVVAITEYTADCTLTVFVLAMECQVITGTFDTARL
jgi:hypothetical protein